MHNIKIGFNFDKHFLNQTYILASFNEDMSKVIFFLFFFISTFNNKGLDTQRFDPKTNYIYITRYKFCLSMYIKLKITL